MPYKDGVGLIFNFSHNGMSIDYLGERKTATVGKLTPKLRYDYIDIMDEVLTRWISGHIKSF